MRDHVLELFHGQNPAMRWEVISHLDPEARRVKEVDGAALMTRLDKTNDAHEARQVLEEWRMDKQTTISEPAITTITALAKRLRAENPALTRNQAEAQVIRDRPDLYRQHAEETTAGRRAVALEAGHAADARNPLVTKPENGGPLKTSEAGAAWDEIQKRALAVMKDDATLSKEAAVAKVCREDQALYDRYAAAARASR